MAAAPDADQQVHGQDGNFVKEKEDEKILRDEDAEDSGHQDQKRDEEILRAIVERPAREHAGHDDQAGQEQQRHPPTVDREPERDPEAGYQRMGFGHLEAACGDVVAQRDQTAGEQRIAGTEERNHAHSEAVAVGNEQQDDRRNEGHRHDAAQQQAAHLESPQKTMTTVPATTAYT